jgi:glutamine amidotransferase
MWVLERPAPDSVLDHHSALGSRVVSDHLASVPSVVVASERLDDDPAWRLLEPGVLLHVDAGLRLARTRLVG